MATTNDLVQILTKKMPDISAQDMNEAVSLVFDFLKNELQQGNRIEIRGFGSFSIRQRKFANKDDFYKTVYYRMSKSNIQK
jgi:integration host factor subunit beta